MKREFLQNFKIGDQTLPKEAIDAILDENSRDIDAAKAKFSDYDTIKQQLADANKAIDEFKAMDIDGVKKVADDWKKKFEQSEAEHARKLADMEFDRLLDSAITGAKGRNAKALRGLLDIDTLKQSKNQSEDIKAALAELKKSDGYLFEDAVTPPPYAGGTGKSPVGGAVTQEAFDKMGYRERLELKKNDPQTYESLKE